MFSFLTQRREQIERQIRNWTNINSRSYDTPGIQQALNKLGNTLESIGLKSVDELTSNPFVKTWETKKGFTGGTLLIGHLDIPLKADIPLQRFHKDPELIFGEGVGLSRGPLVMMEFVLRGLRSIRCLHKMPLGVLYYADEGYDYSYSSQIISAATAKAEQVLLLRPGNWGNKVITQRRGQRRYLLKVESKPKRLGKANNQPHALDWVCEKVSKISGLSSREKKIAVAVSNITVDHYPMLLPHNVHVTLQMSYRNIDIADATERKVREILGKGIKWELEMVSDRPPMKFRRGNQKLFNTIRKVADRWDIPIEQESSLWPTVAGLVPSSTKVLCGLGPVAKDLYTPHEAIQRISVLQRTLLLGEFLVQVHDL
jgi:D-alanine-D-alanine ligase